MLAFKSLIMTDMKVKGIPRIESKPRLIYFSDGKVPLKSHIQLYSKKARVDKRDHTGHASRPVKSESKMERKRQGTKIVLAVKIWLVILSVKNCKGHRGTPIDSSSIVKFLTIFCALVCERTTSI